MVILRNCLHVGSISGIWILAHFRVKKSIFGLWIEICVLMIIRHLLIWWWLLRRWFIMVQLLLLVLLFVFRLFFIAIWGQIAPQVAQTWLVKSLGRLLYNLDVLAVIITTLDPLLLLFGLVGEIWAQLTSLEKLLSALLIQNLATWCALANNARRLHSLFGVVVISVAYKSSFTHTVSIICSSSLKFRLILILILHFQVGVPLWSTLHILGII